MDIWSCLRKCPGSAGCRVLELEPMSAGEYMREGVQAQRIVLGVRGQFDALPVLRVRHDDVRLHLLKCVYCVKSGFLPRRFKVQGSYLVVIAGRSVAVARSTFILHSRVSVNVSH